MRFVERVFDYTDEHIVCEALVPCACPLACEGAAPAIVAIEAAAQAAAVGEALRRTRAGARKTAPSGYLVSLRDVELAVATVPVDAPLIVVVRLQSMVLPLSTYAVEAFCQGRPVLRGSIGTFLAHA
jgi:predicted hotdog family 3-hydroxylacyl-ACP dehydratase